MSTTSTLPLLHLTRGVWTRCVTEPGGVCRRSPVGTPPRTLPEIARAGGGVVVVRHPRRVSPMTKDGFFWTAPMDGNGYRHYYDREGVTLPRSEREALIRRLKRKGIL